MFGCRPQKAGFTEQIMTFFLALEILERIDSRNEKFLAAKRHIHVDVS
jgi:hypothetical protein